MKRELIIGYMSVHPWMLIDFNELTRQQIEKATTANSEGAAGMPNREGDNEGQAGVDETKHS